MILIQYYIAFYLLSVF